MDLLKTAYDKIVFAYGSSKNNDLNIANEYSPNVFSARNSFKIRLSITQGPSSVGITEILNSNRFRWI